MTVDEILETLIYAIAVAFPTTASLKKLTQQLEILPFDILDKTGKLNKSHVDTAKDIVAFCYDTDNTYGLCLKCYDLTENNIFVDLANAFIKYPDTHQAKIKYHYADLTDDIVKRVKTQTPTKANLPANNKDKPIKQLKENIVKHFSMSELADLCLSLNIRFEQIPGDAIDAKARELVLFCERRLLLDELVDECQKERPKIDWGNKPTKLVPKHSIGKLRVSLRDFFNFTELMMLCLEFGFIKEVALSSQRLEIIQALLTHCTEQETLQKLWDRIRELKPIVDDAE